MLWTTSGLAVAAALGLPAEFSKEGFKIDDGHGAGSQHSAPRKCVSYTINSLTRTLA